VPRQPDRKKGAFTRAEIQKRYRQRLKRTRPDPKTVVKQQRRAERERELSEATIRASQVLGTELFGVLYVDPPWRDIVYSRDTGSDRAADNHYPTMPLDELKALHLPAAKHCVLFLWTTISQLYNAMQLLEAWGFTYKSAHIWAKPKIGTGRLVRDNAELLLWATCGKPVAPAPGTQLPCLLEAPQGRHSEKPEVFAEHIEKLFPNALKLEMFARGEPRPGWQLWGNEAVEADPEAPVSASAAAGR
jgi:N6-adenosine-specific RNA methylase IME4